MVVLNTEGRNTGFEIEIHWKRCIGVVQYSRLATRAVGLAEPTLSSVVVRSCHGLIDWKTEVTTTMMTMATVSMLYTEGSRQAQFGCALTDLPSGLCGVVRAGLRELLKGQCYYCRIMLKITNIVTKSLINGMALVN